MDRPTLQHTTTVFPFTSIAMISKVEDNSLVSEVFSYCCLRSVCSAPEHSGTSSWSAWTERVIPVRGLE